MKEIEKIAAENLQDYAGLDRAIEIQEMYINLDDYKEGTIMRLDDVRSFTGPDASSPYVPENLENGVKIYFCVDGTAAAHKVNYTDKKEVEFLNAEKWEDTYLIPGGTCFKITRAPQRSDLEETGAFFIDIEQISAADFEKLKADGTPVNSDINL